MCLSSKKNFGHSNAVMSTGKGTIIHEAYNKHFLFFLGNTFNLEEHSHFSHNIESALPLAVYQLNTVQCAVQISSLF